MWRIAENIVHRYVSGARAKIGTHARHNSCSWHMEKHMIMTKIRNDIYYIRIQNLKSFCCVVFVAIVYLLLLLLLHTTSLSGVVLLIQGGTTVVLLATSIHCFFTIYKNALNKRGSNPFFYKSVVFRRHWLWILSKIKMSDNSFYISYLLKMVYIFFVF